MAMSAVLKSSLGVALTKVLQRAMCTGLSVVSHTPVEVARLDGLQRAGGFVDAVRHFVPPEERLYTWWSYRARDWAASDRGRRLDHVWVTPPLVGSLAAARVLRDSRGWAKASDHVPVMIELG